MASRKSHRIQIRYGHRLHQPITSTHPLFLPTTCLHLHHYNKPAGPQYQVLRLYAHEESSARHLTLIVASFYRHTYAKHSVDTSATAKVVALVSLG